MADGKQVMESDGTFFITSDGLWDICESCCNLFPPTITDFTVECFIRMNSLPASNNSFLMFEIGTLDLLFQIGNSAAYGAYSVDCYCNSNLIRATFPSPSTGTWYHLAVTRSGSTITLYLNGSSIGTGTQADAVSAGDWKIGGRTADSELDGWMDEFRLSTVARTVSVPIAEYASDASTYLLLHMNGTDASTTFTDDSGDPRTVTANGNAQIDTAQKKFGTASGLFDGTGDYLSVT